MLITLVGHLHIGRNLYAKYHDPSLSASPDILLTMFHMFTMQ